MADDFIQVPPDSIGKKVDVESITRPDGSIVEQQRVQIDMTLTNSLLRQMLDEIQEIKLYINSALR